MRSIKMPLRPYRHAPGWPLLAALGAGVFVLAVAWFTFGSSITGSSNQPPDRYVEAVPGSPSRINPLFAYLNDTDRDLSTLIFSGLTRLGPGGEVLPDLAKSWEISSDGRVVTFHLREDVRWHTGAPFSAEDVVFTYNLLKEPALRADPGQAPLWRQIHCHAPNESTVSCQLPGPFSPFFAFAAIGILPAHILGAVEPSALFDDPFNRHPVGTGPFRLTELNSMHAVLKANAGYHLGAPGIGEIEFRFHAGNAAAAAAVVSGEADGLLLDPSATQAEFDALIMTGGLRAYTANRTAYTILYMNNATPPLNDKAVRRAIAAAIDVQQIVSEVLGPRAVVAGSPIVPGTWAYNPEITPYEHDDDDARRALEEAGWELPDGGDVRVKDGVELRISLLTDQDAVRGAIAGRIAGELDGVGIAATVVREDSTALVRDFLIPREYQAAIFGWDPGPDPDPYPAWHSSQMTEAGRNLANYQSTDADPLLEQARRTIDLDHRQRLYYRFQEIFHEDVPSLLLYYSVSTYFVREGVSGIELGVLFDTGSRFRNVHQWRVESIAGLGN
jgi:peptide/nickel transport system substrate-binding protein